MIYFQAPIESARTPGELFDNHCREGCTNFIQAPNLIPVLAEAQRRYQPYRITAQLKNWRVVEIERAPASP